MTFSPCWNLCAPELRFLLPRYCGRITPPRTGLLALQGRQRQGSGLRPGGRPVRAQQAVQGQERALHHVLRRHHLLEELQIRRHGDRGRMEERLLVPRRVPGMEGSGDADRRQEGIGGRAYMKKKKPDFAGLF